VQDYPKLSQTYYVLLERLAQDHMPFLAALQPDAALYVLASISEGLTALGTTSHSYHHHSISVTHTLSMRFLALRTGLHLRGTHCARYHLTLLPPSFHFCHSHPLDAVPSSTYWPPSPRDSLRSVPPHTLTTIIPFLSLTPSRCGS
jgi:hypothetical protein